MDQDELRALEDQCIQEHAPECTATCPIHVDARGICIEIAKGDFATGLKIFRKTAPFPGILSQLCDQPCQTTCLRKDIGGAIELRKLEQALMNFGGAVEHPRPLPAKPRNVAVIGAGMSGLTVAYDLAKKGYQVKISSSRGKRDVVKGSDGPSNSKMTKKMLVGFMGGYTITDMQVTLATTSATVDMGGNGYGAKVLFDYGIMNNLWFRGMVGLENFSAGGVNNSGCTGGAECNVNIDYLAFDFWGRWA